MKQAQKIPAYLHPENDQAPKPANGKTFIEAGLMFVDPSDSAAYCSNGYGYFEGINMRCVREHPGHTLLPVAADNCELGYGDLDRLLGVARSAAGEFDRKTQAEIDMRWIMDRLAKHGVDYERQRVPGSTDKHPFYVLATLCGYTQAADDAVRAEIDEWVIKKREQVAQQKEERKANREWMKTIGEREIAQKMSQQKTDDLQQIYKGLHSMATAAGITNERFTVLFKMTAESGKAPALSDESLALLGQFVENDIEVIAAKQGAAPQPEPLGTFVEALAAEGEPDADDLSPIEIALTSTEMTPQEKEEYDKEVAAGELLKQATADGADLLTVAARLRGEAPMPQPEQAQETTDEEEQEAPARGHYVDSDGCCRWEDTDELVELDPETAGSLELLADAPVQEEQKKFTVDNDGALRWYTRKVRSSQKRIEDSKRDLDEAKRAHNAIKIREEGNIKGLKWALGRSVLDFVRSLLTVKGRVKVASHHVMEGTIKLTRTGGLTCHDKTAFKTWWQEMHDPDKDGERALYAHSVKYGMTETQIAANIKDGLEVPGYSLMPVIEHGDFEITEPPKKRKGADDDDQSEDDSDEDAA